jgi:hypothetical protein
LPKVQVDQDQKPKHGDLPVGVRLLAMDVNDDAYQVGASTM